jgi:acetylornithine deacetylase
MVEKSFIENTLADLVQINSVNPDLDSNGCGEQEIGMYINRLLESFQLKSEIHSLGPERINVVGILEGTGEGKSLMLNAHMDTVGVQGMQNPFSGAVKDGKLYGRGAYDMKGSIAAMLAVAKAIKEQNIKFAGDLVLAFVADEEFESKGTQQLIREYKTNGAIVAEPTDLNICLAHRGFAVYEITTKGKTAHGGNNHIGIDANSKMGLLLAELDALSNKLSRKKGHPLLGQASVHVPLIKGGQSLFIYSDECTINVERRTLPGESGKDILSELESIIEKISRRDDNFKATIKPLIWREPYEISENKPVVDSLRQSAVSVLGRQPSYIGHSWWEDSALIGKNGTETVIMGPKGGGIHEAVEWVDIQSVVDLSEIFLKTAIIYCSENQ